MDKNDIRQLTLQKRRSLSELTVQQASTNICKTILNLEKYKSSKSIGLYMAVNNEVNIELIWQDAIYNQKKCYFPKIIDENYMIFLPGNNFKDFSKNKWNILEPTTNHSNSYEINKLDLLIIPLVAFDNLGNRIGMGKGFYDKALQNYHSTTLIGVAYDFQKVSLIKSETWDIKLDIIITEKMIYSF